VDHVSRYLVDTSIWVEFFRGRSQAIKNRVLALLDTNRVLVSGVVISELLLGARGKREADFVKEKLARLAYLTTDRDFFISCGIIGSEVRKSGINMPLSDIMIAAHARLNDLLSSPWIDILKPSGLLLGYNTKS
jgi:predicted nucleic acid-binding protein